MFHPTPSPGKIGTFRAPSGTLRILSGTMSAFLENLPTNYLTNERENKCDFLRYLMLRLDSKISFDL